MYLERESLRCFQSEFIKFRLTNIILNVIDIYGLIYFEWSSSEVEIEFSWSCFLCMQQVLITRLSKLNCINQYSSDSGKKSNNC